ncbi:MAG: DEAD/DEAH box helicase [Thermomicrobiales bacterium]
MGAGTLHPEAARVFRRGKDLTPNGSAALHLHRHQQEAVELAQTGASYVLTTGTGSGKSLAYFIPIIDYVLQHGSGNGIKAIVVYPMNALCNSQLLELRKFLIHGYGEGNEPVRFARYTGQESRAEREETASRPPDVLLTNYVMLELLMTRVDGNDARIIEAARGLEFLVLDEMHTYRGRQGADVAMLVRRVRERIGAPTMRCIGTSATISGQGTREDRHAAVAAVASKLFGSPVTAGQVVGETLQPAITRPEPDRDELRFALLAHPFDLADVEGDPYEAIRKHPLAWWVESAFGIQRDDLGRLERKAPITLAQAAADLSEVTVVDIAVCRAHLQAMLLAGYATAHPETGRPLFAFRLHQFVSRGDTVYSTLQSGPERHLALEGQVFVPGDRDRRLFPLAFCRQCGQAYSVVDWVADAKVIEPRRLNDVTPADSASTRRSGFLFADPTESWDGDPERLPEEWLETRANGSVVVRRDAKNRIPVHLFVRPDGEVSEVGGGDCLSAWFLPAPFRFCLNCLVSYSGRAGGDFSRLAELATEGRSTATTVLSLAIVRALQAVDPGVLSAEARKLLSFTDNRQDASLQAGHLNDFVQIALLRGALWAAVNAAGGDGLGHEEIAQAVTRALGLDFSEYAKSPDAEFGARRDTERALREVVGYRVYLDLRRGWRVTTPNLEQTGLLRVNYESLPDVCAAEHLWADRHPALATATPEQRRAACLGVLDFFRRELAIDVPYLEPDQQERIKLNAGQRLIEPWSIDEDEPMREAPVIRVGVRNPRARQAEVTVSGRSAVGRRLRQRQTWPDFLERDLPMAALDELAADLFAVLAKGGLLVNVGSEQAPLYRLQAAEIRWMPGDGRPQTDWVRRSHESRAEVDTNAFFRELYQTIALSLRGIGAREHTAQVPSVDRQAREDEFRAGKLAILYCSPTMELGVDIADLNAVNMRNVPPTPANYAQRSGRAGRSGQPALVLTYCSSLSPHDQYFFRRQEKMVAGAVSPPRIDLANEELLLAHLHAVWLAETGQDLRSSLGEILDLESVDDGLPIRDDVRFGLFDSRAQERALARGKRLLAALQDDLEGAIWLGPGWLERAIEGAPRAFDQACDRWRQLYLAACRQRDTQNEIVRDASAGPDQVNLARRLRGEAETQIALLRDTGSSVNSDFYSYRYFASEGFLPGYNFPRLPLAAYLPGKRAAGSRDEFVSRARFLAISEFGPRNIIYYEGNRYRIDKVILPVAEGESGSRTEIGKVCAKCGYAHVGEQALDERCRYCNALLDGSARYFGNLFRLQNVSTRRVDRITSDEEERQRQGYELLTTFRFGADESGKPVYADASFIAGGADPDEAPRTLATAAYAPAATLRRLNLGWNRRKDPSLHGFLLDMERGTWAKQEQEEPAGKDTEGASQASRANERVVPYVEDRRNALLLMPQGDMVSPDLLPTLQYALKRGIEAHFQLEESELGVELLPTRDNPQSILFYESAEGGAGVLARLVEEPQALADVARAALEVCHFDPETGDDQQGAPGAPEPCEAACYNCLLSYTNQRDHPLLDRKRVLPALEQFRDAAAQFGTRAASRETQRDQLAAVCESGLERRFVTWLYEGGYRLPDRAQLYLERFQTRPDFFYDESQACIYVDGPHHEFPERQQRDREAQSRFEDGGFEVVRVQDESTWPEAVARYSWIFGKGAPA